MSDEHDRPGLFRSPPTTTAEDFRKRVETLLEAATNIGATFKDGKWREWKRMELVYAASRTFWRLKNSLEDPTSPVTWEKPAGMVETVVVASRSEVVGIPWPISNEYCGDESQKLIVETFAARMVDVCLFGELTEHVIVIRNSEGETVQLPPRLDAECPEDGAGKADFLEEVKAPRGVSGRQVANYLAATLADEEKRDECEELEPFVVAGVERVDGWRMALFFDVAPLVIDEDAQEAFFTLTATLQLLRVPDEDGGEVEVVHGAPPPEVAEQLWQDAFSSLKSLEGESLQKGEAAHYLESSSPMKPADRRLTEPPPRYLLDGPTRIDRETLALVNATSTLRLPKKWSRVRKWDDLAREEVARLLDTYGEDAYRDGLVVKKYAAGGKEVLVELTRDGEDELLEREGAKGFRRVYRDAGLDREYLVKRIRSGAGWVEARLSWSGTASLLVNDVREKSRRDLEALRRELSQPTLFEDLDEEARKQVDGQLRFLEHVRDAGPVMEYLLRKFGHEGVNPLHVPAWQLRYLLHCEADEHGHRRVKGCLQALQELRFHLARTGDGRRENTWGSFLYEVKEYLGGPGKHTDGDFILTISPAAVGCLKVFETTKGKLPGKLARDVDRSDFGKTLSKEERKALNYVKSASVVVPFFDQAAGLTTQQARLRTWLEHNLTTNGDTAAGGRKKVVDRTSEDAAKPRIYRRDFCPLLPPDRDFHAALGHARTRHAEKGWKLVQAETSPTSTGGGRPAGLVDVMGYEYPPGAAATRRAKTVRLALADMKKLVVELLGGVVAAKYGGKWMSLEEAAQNLPPDDLAKRVLWSIFLPDDWHARVVETIEADSEERHARGETPYRVRVTKDRGVYERSQEDRGLPLSGEPVEGGDVDDSSPLSFRQRLRAARIAKGLKQAEVAALFGVSQQAYGTWETGKKPVPYRLAHLMEKWIVDGVEPTEEELSEEA